MTEDIVLETRDGTKVHISEKMLVRKFQGFNSSTEMISGLSPYKKRGLTL